MKINATINRVAFAKNNGKKFWLILVTNMGTFKGEMGVKPKEGAEFTFKGAWGVFRGQKEFKFMGAMPVIPANNEALLLFCCKNALGIGDKLKEAIWSEYGNDWIDRFESSEIKGLTTKKKEALKEAIAEAKLNETQVQVLSFLMQKGCSEGLAYKCWNEWAMDTISKVEANCFCMTDLFMVSFSSIDGNISNAFGLDAEDPRRITSGVLYAYNQLVLSGRTAVEVNELLKQCIKTLSLSACIINAILQIMLDSHNFKLFNVGEKCFFSLWEDYAIELNIHNYVREVVK